jgi:hypothetical protein
MVKRVAVTGSVSRIKGWPVPTYTIGPNERRPIRCCARTVQCEDKASETTMGASILPLPLLLAIRGRFGKLENC